MAETSKEAGETVAGSKKPEVPEKLIKQIAEMRQQVHESFGKIAMTMMMLPRYRHQSIADMQHFLLEPLIRDRVAIAYPKDEEKGAVGDLAGVAIWASVSDEVDAKVREQIKANVFPIRLRQEEWTSGTNNWLLDVIAPNAKAAAQVIANFRSVVKEGDLRLHPGVAGMLDPEVLEKLGARRGAKAPEPSDA